MWIASFLAVFVWSAINPKDYLTWVLEVSPAVIAFVVLSLTYKSFRLTRLAYALILIHCVILMVGGHYTYAEVPLFDELFGATRNNYDKLGHLAQGFIPALVTREIVIRNSVFRNGAWESFFIVSFCLAFSAFYELIEWWVALFSGDDAVSFLGTQGYIWDTQSDMAWALVGATMSLVMLSKWHDRQLAATTWKPVSG